MRRLLALSLVVACGGPDAPAETPPWMSTVADAHLLSELSIPGTHESAALYEPLQSGTAKCQELTLAEQLSAGVRYFDIRCRDLNDAFAIFHGPIDEQQTFDDVLATMTAFAHPSETVMMSIKQESTPEGTTRSFEDTFRAYVAKAPDLWYLGAAVPALGQVRGKIVLVRRFAAATTPLGLDASGWADNTTFTLATPDATLRVQDQYAVTSDDTKWMEITALLAEARSGPASTLYLDYTSGYETKNGLPNTPAVETVINPMIDTYLADPANAQVRLGVMAMDFVTEPRARAVAHTNVPDHP